jgi:hypothetical protein
MEVNRSIVDQMTCKNLVVYTPVFLAQDGSEKIRRHQTEKIYLINNSCVPL